MQPVLLFSIAFLLNWALLTGARPQAADEGSAPVPVAGNNGNDRAMGYSKKGKAAPTAKPTWRPEQISHDVQNPAVDVPDENSAEPDEVFDAEYYDDYDSNVEGTKRHMQVFHTFEERMRTYVKMIHQLHAANGNKLPSTGASAKGKPSPKDSNSKGSRSVGGVGGGLPVVGGIGILG